ncbi:MAG: response regulator transcription factor [Thermoleophilia bacterium]
MGEPLDSTIWIVDDDPSVRRSLVRLLHACGYNAQACESAEEFLKSEWRRSPGCLVLDVRLPNLSGLELQSILQERGAWIPVVFITGHGDIPMSVRAMKAGSVDFLTKPFTDQALLAAVKHALMECEGRMTAAIELEDIRRRLDSLSPREQEVLSRVVAGRLNKQIAAELGIAMRTVKLHRAHAMEKLGVRTVADLVRLVEKAGPES